MGASIFFFIGLTFLYVYVLLLCSVPCRVGTGRDPYRVPDHYHQHQHRFRAPVLVVLGTTTTTLARHDTTYSVLRNASLARWSPHGARSKTNLLRKEV